MNKLIKQFLILFCSIVVLTSCSNSYYATKYQAKNMKKFSVAKRSGMSRFFIKKPKQKLSPTYTKPVKDYYGN
jgi:hypothetical protein